jgi:hypothetical protein
LEVLEELHKVLCSLLLGSGSRRTNGVAGSDWLVNPVR